ncbi:MAG: replicative DNA helicase [bacterium]|nr:replicative DNA helicase [bacterium]
MAQNVPPTKLPPQNIEAEQSLLGSVLIDRETLDRVGDIIVPEDFYRGAHQKIYASMLDLYMRRDPVDVLSLTNRLEEKKELAEIGGVTYLAELVNTVPSSSHAVMYARIVQKKKMLRDLISASQHILELGFSETEDVENLLEKAEQQILSVAKRSLKQEFIPLKTALGEAFERIEKLQKEGVLRGVGTGFTDLDKKLGGLQRGDLVILAARPSLGKTSLALDIARHVAIKEKIPIGLFSLEMSTDSLVDRLIAAEAHVDSWRLRTGGLSSEGDGNDFERIQHALGILSESKLFIDDAASPTIIQIRTMARRLQAEHGLGLIIVDYLQLIYNPNAESMVQQVTEISRSLKSLARELEVPVLAISQLSRAVESRPDQVPRLSDLRESGSIEQDADVVMFIHREDRVKKDSDKKNIAKIMIAKHRNGPTGEIELYFDEKETSFKNLEKHFGGFE